MTEKDEYFKTGFADLDKLIRIKKNEGALITVAGRVGVGKTAFALSLVEKFVQDGKKVLYFSLEYTTKLIENRLLSIFSKVDFDKIKNNTVSEKDTEIVNKKVIEYTKSNLYIDDIPDNSIENIIKTTENHTPEIVIIDYLDIVNCQQKKLKREEQLNLMIGELKKFAKEKGIIIFLLTQASKQCDYRDDKRPLLSDNSFLCKEKFSDIVIFIYSDEYYKKWDREYKQTKDVEQVELIVAKNKYGKTGTVYVNFDPKTIKFYTEEIGR